ncbi:AMP-binding protein [uncultured Oxalicibacterium sp.]|uniref:AMP-binding protein n=1 Tax=uncultured Oxalicibacterium sp. TaxID=1168540 RepID=UPI0025F84385|nr:AMP-binding protein [uncultured Oxalicibacterium sp.]
MNHPLDIDPASDLFARLRHQAARLPLEIATDSSRRAISYRRLWSRIERATARLQGEWHVQSGDCIVYWGNAHPDALILYIAVARCNARLLPLERAALREHATEIGAHYQPKAIVHDDGLHPPARLAAPVVASLPDLLSVRCHYDEEVEENDALPSLIDLDWQSGGLVERSYSLHQLMQMDNTNADSDTSVQAELFDPVMLATRIFPALMRGDALTFR